MPCCMLHNININKPITGHGSGCYDGIPLWFVLVCCCESSPITITLCCQLSVVFLIPFLHVHVWQIITSNIWKVRHTSLRILIGYRVNHRWHHNFSLICAFWLDETHVGYKHTKTPSLFLLSAKWRHSKACDVRLGRSAYMPWSHRGDRRVLEHFFFGFEKWDGKYFFSFWNMYDKYFRCLTGGKDISVSRKGGQGLLGTRDYQKSRFFF